MRYGMPYELAKAFAISTSPWYNGGVNGRIVSGESSSNTTAATKSHNQGLGDYHVKDWPADAQGTGPRTRFAHSTTQLETRLMFPTITLPGWLLSRDEIIELISRIKEVQAELVEDNRVLDPADTAALIALEALLDAHNAEITLPKGE